MKVQKWFYIIIVTFFQEIVSELPTYDGYSTTGEDGYSPPSAREDSTGYSYATPTSRIIIDSKEYEDAPDGPYKTPPSSYAPSQSYKAPYETVTPVTNQVIYNSPPQSEPEEYKPYRRKPFNPVLYSRDYLNKKYLSNLAAKNQINFKPSPDITAAIFKPKPPLPFTPSAGYPNKGTKSVGYSSRENIYNDVSVPAIYEFSYKIEDSDSASDFGHKEGRNGDKTWGSYSVLLPDGRRQIVEYTADANGYRPKIRYENAHQSREAIY